MPGTGVEVGSIARAGAGMTVPTQGSTVGDMADTMGKVLAGMEARRQVNEAKALEQAKLAVSKQQADAQTVQANAYQTSVDTQTRESGVRIQASIQAMDLNETAEERAIAEHNLEQARGAAELSEFQASRASRVRNAPVNRRMLRDAALASPQHVPWKASDIDLMDDIALADNARWWRDFQTTRMNQTGAAGGAILGAVTSAYNGAVTRAQAATVAHQTALAHLADTEQAVLDTKMFQRDPESQRLILAIAPETARREVVEMNQAYQRALAQVSYTEQQALQAQEMANQVQGVMQQSIREMEATLGMQVSDELRDVLTGMGANADSILGPDPAAQGQGGGRAPAPGRQEDPTTRGQDIEIGPVGAPARPGPAGTSMLPGTDATWLPGPNGSMIAAPSAKVMQDLAFSSKLDPAVYEQQVAALRGRYPGVDLGMQQMHGVDNESLRMQRVQQQQLAMQDAQDRAFMLGDVAGASENALHGMAYVIRNGLEGDIANDPTLGLEVSDMVRRLAESGMTRDRFASFMRERLPRAKMEGSLVYDFAIQRLPNRVGGN